MDIVLLIHEAITQSFKIAPLFHDIDLTLSLWIDIYVVYSFCLEKQCCNKHHCTDLNVKLWQNCNWITC